MWRGRRVCAAGGLRWGLGGGTPQMPGFATQRSSHYAAGEGSRSQADAAHALFRRCKRWPCFSRRRAPPPPRPSPCAADRHPEISCYQPDNWRLPCTHTIKKRQWLGKVADIYGHITIDDILELNPHLDGERTVQHTTLKLPCESERPRMALGMRPAGRRMRARSRAVAAAGVQPGAAGAGQKRQGSVGRALTRRLRRRSRCCCRACGGRGVGDGLAGGAPRHELLHQGAALGGPGAGAVE